jgi:hypothetical protein
VQQLKVKLQQLEQVMDEVEGKLNDLEGQPAYHHASEGGPSGEFQYGRRVNFRNGFNTVECNFPSSSERSFEAEGVQAI